MSLARTASLCGVRSLSRGSRPMRLGLSSAMRAAIAGGTPYAQGSAMPCKPSSVSMMQIEQSALGTWKVALYHCA